MEAFGLRLAPVNRRGEALLFHFPAADGDGAVVSTAAEAARDLHEFVGDCWDRARGASASTD